MICRWMLTCTLCCLEKVFWMMPSLSYCPRKSSTAHDYTLLYLQTDLFSFTNIFNCFCFLYKHNAGWIINTFHLTSDSFSAGPFICSSMLLYYGRQSGAGHHSPRGVAYTEGGNQTLKTPLNGCAAHVALSLPSGFLVCAVHWLVCTRTCWVNDPQLCFTTAPVMKLKTSLRSASFLKEEESLSTFTLTTCRGILKFVSVTVMEGVDGAELWVFADCIIAICFIVWSDAVVL